MGLPSRTPGTPKGLVPQRGAGSGKETAEEVPEVAFLIRTCESDCTKPSIIRHFNQAHGKKDCFILLFLL